MNEMHLPVNNVKTRRFEAQLKLFVIALVFMHLSSGSRSRRHRMHTPTQPTRKASNKELSSKLCEMRPHATRTSTPQKTMDTTSNSAV